MPVAAAFLLGAWLDDLVGVPSWAPPAAGAVLLVAAFRWRRRDDLLGHCPLLLLIAVTGFGRHHLQRHLTTHRLDFPGGEGERVRVTATGVIRSPVHHTLRDPPFGRRLRTTRFDLSLGLIEGAGFRLPTRALVRVMVGEEARGLRFGDRVEVRGWLRRPSPPTNPGGRDHAEVFKRRGLSGFLSVGSERDLMLVGRGQGGALLAALHRCRAYTLALIRRRLEHDSAALVSCMLLGEREGIPPEMREAFERSGTLHLLAISGLHVALLVSFVWLALRGLGLSPRAATGAIFIFLVGYAVLTGLRPSVVRASIMIAIFLGGQIIGRRPDPLHSLAASAIVLVALLPQEIHSAGFHLSYLSVLSIILLRGPIISFLTPSRERPTAAPGAGPTQGAAAIPGMDLLERVFRAAARALREMVALSLAASIGTAPLVLHLFHIVTPGVVLSNLIVLPIVWVLLVSAFLLAMTGIVFPPAVLVLGPVADAAAWLLLFSVRNLSRLPASHLYLPSTSLALCASYGLVAAFLLRRRLPRILKTKRLCIAGFVVVILIAAGPLFPGRPVLRVTFLDVGLGSACVIRLPGGDTVLYDCGSDRGAAPGRWIIAPALWAEGVSRIDALILSHSHSDHLSAVPSIIEMFPLGAIIVPPGFLESGNGKTVSRMAAARSIPIQVAARGDRVAGLGKGTLVEVLGPPRDPPSRLSPNDGSLVIRISTLGRSVLLTGDIEERGTRLLLRGSQRVHEAARGLPPDLPGTRHQGGGRGGLQDLRADLLCVPHHGGDNPLSPALARAVAPDLAVLSTREGFPEPAVVEAWRAGGARILSTAEGGAVRISLSHKELRVQRFRADPW